jgi:hypothetical protein
MVRDGARVESLDFDEPSEGSIELHVGGMGVGENRATTIKVLAQGFQIGFIQRRNPAAVQVQEWIGNQAWIARKKISFVCIDIEGRRRLFERFHHVGDGARSKVPVTCMLESAYSQGASFGRFPRGLLLLGDWLGLRRGQVGGLGCL